MSISDKVIVINWTKGRFLYLVFISMEMECSVDLDIFNIRDVAIQSTKFSYA